MAGKNRHLQLSVFDRLIADDGSGTIGEAVDDVAIVRRAVLRDVENLLNTRRCIVRLPEGFVHLGRSMYTYGIEDFTAKNPKVPHVRQALRRTILNTIDRFEPRLKNLSVAFRSDRGNSQDLCFGVRATLHAEPIRESITFDTWFSAGRGEYRIDNIK
jgi:type VI secretion system protein ImpF